MRHKGLIAIGFLVGLLMLGLLADVVRVNQAKTKLENILEFCAEEGVKWIDNPMIAREITRQRAMESGVYLTDDQIRINQRDKELGIIYSETIKTTFGWLLGRSEVDLQFQIKAGLDKGKATVI
ncbi:MAG: hypothetical protein QME81_09510 [bacterium]|nr:hypothetical protein [bacterium]